VKSWGALASKHATSDDGADRQKWRYCTLATFGDVIAPSAGLVNFGDVAGAPIVTSSAEGLVFPVSSLSPVFPLV